MFLSDEALTKLIALGAPPERLAEVLRLIERDMESVTPRPALTSGAERTRRYRDRRASQGVTVTSPSVTERHKASLSPSFPPLSPKPPNPHPSIRDVDTTREGLAEFEAWYGAYPNKVGKPAARNAFKAAIRKAPLAELLSGLARYVADKPPDRAWCNPATWLNQERWKDEPATPITPQARPHERPQQNSRDERHARAFAGAMDYLDELERRDRGSGGGGSSGPSGPGDGEGGYPRLAGPLSAVR